MEYLIANWKANDSLELAKNWFDLWSKNSRLNGLTTVVCPSFPLLSFVSAQPATLCGAQDLPPAESLKFIKYCIVGHSDTRKLGETLETIKSKTEILIGAGITPIICFEDLNDLIFVKDYILKSILAYEPTKNISQNGEYKELNFGELKNIAQNIKNTFGDNISLLYGGSVNIGNVLQIKNLNVFNGVLVGKASLDPVEFYQLGKNMGAVIVKKSKLKIFIIPAIVIVLVGLFFVFGGNIFSSVFSISKIIPSKNLPSFDGRTNILLIGVDKNQMLTDSLMVVSIPQNPGKIVIVSLPRDLWVEYKTGASAKINEVYAYAGSGASNFNADTGLVALKGAVTRVTGMPIHYFAKVDFNGFLDAINSLGGIRITVQNTFDDYGYPAVGQEANTCGLTEEQILDGKDEDYIITEIDYPCRFEHLHFDKGVVVMNGENALKYARSRHSVSSAEGSDFARAKRQQQVLLAVKEKVLSADTLLNAKKISDLFAIYNKYLETDIKVADAEALFEVGAKSDTTNIKTAVLNNSSVTDGTGSGLLYTPTDTTLYAGKWVLLPRGGSYSTIHAFIQKLLFDE